jgi:DNA-directed RNA polymerase II subunit RPB2
MDIRFQIVKELFGGTSDLITHHLDSYERFLVHQIPQTLQEISPIKIPLVQKTKARVLDRGGREDDEGRGSGVEAGAEETGAATESGSSSSPSGSGSGEEGVRRGIEYEEEDRIDANTYSDYDAIVSIYLGGKSGTNVNVHKPILYDSDKKTPLLPNEARLRGYSYTTTLTTDITIRIVNLNTGEAREETLTNAPFIDIPIMIHSNACWLNDMTNEALSEVGEDPDDPGGYFIINGSERVLVTQERVIPNMAYVNSVPEVMMACSQPDSTKVKILRLSFGKRGIVASVPGTKGLVPVGVLFRSLGVISDQDIVKCIFNTDRPDPEETDMIRSTLAASHGIYDQHSAMRLLTHVSRGLTIASAHGIVHRQLFSQQRTLPEKAALLGDLVRMLIHRKLGRIQDTDRDSTMNKSLAVSGTLMSEVFSNIIQTREEEIRKKVSSEYNYNYVQYSDDKVFNLIPLIVRSKDDIFGNEDNTSLLMRSMKGQWGADPERGIPSQADGVSQALDRLTYTSALSHLRRVVLERIPDGKALLARRLHMSSYGYICPSETPSGGPKIGVVKNLAILASVSAGVSSHEIKEYLYSIGVVPCNLVAYNERGSVYRVMLNGVLLGYTDRPLDIREELLRMRRKGLLHPTVSIAHNHSKKLLWIGSGPGRLLRPLIRIKDGVPMIREAIAKFTEIQRRGGDPYEIFSVSEFTGDVPIRKSTGESDGEVPLELIDPWEMENLLVANYESEITPNHTHLEVHPSTIFGVMGSLIPFAPHNQGPRNIYSCAQSKQGTSVYSKAYLSRYDHSAMVLTSTQKPAVSTWYGRRIANGMLAYGTNLIVAIACFSGYNQEDGVLVNRSSVERGLFRVLKFSEEASEEEDNKRTNTQIRFKDPRSYSGVRLKEKADYSYLDADGLLPEGTIVKPGMVLIGRVSEQEGSTPNDVSIVAGKFAGGVIDSRVILRDHNGLRKVRYRIAKLRSPELGDKFSSRAGQKGTNGMLIAEADMPRTADGIVPDLVVNPHAIPSRMTIGQLQEVIMGKLSCLIGCETDATSFTQNGVFSETIGNMLQNAGYDPRGDEYMYSGITGEKLYSKIFIGPTYYMRLKHMAQDKINYRGGGVERGPVDARTRQPVGGRAREGGLRIGEMERDSLLSYGASMFIQESLTERADGEKAILCANTGKRGFYGEHGYRSVELDAPLPAGDTKSDAFSKITMPRGLNVLLNELETMGIDTRVVTDRAGDRVRHNEKVRLNLESDVGIEQEGKGRGEKVKKTMRANKTNKTKKNESKEGKHNSTKKVIGNNEETVQKTIDTLKKELDRRKDTANLVKGARRIIEQKGLGRNREEGKGLNLLSRLQEPPTNPLIDTPTQHLSTETTNTPTPKEPDTKGQGEKNTEKEPDKGLTGKIIVSKAE